MTGAEQVDIFRHAADMVALSVFLWKLPPLVNAARALWSEVFG